MESAAGWADGVRHAAIRVGLWMATAPVWLIAGLLIAASLLRNGFVVWNWYELSPFLLTDWAGPASAFQANVLLNAVASGWQGLGGDPTSFAWQVVQVIVTLAVLAAIAALVIRRTPLRGTYLPLALVLSTGIPAVLWREIGRYDALFLLGIAAAMLARRPVLVWIGVAVAALSSPEQLVAAGILLLLLSGLPEFRPWRAAAARLLIAGAVVVAAVQVWFAVAGDPGKTRIGLVLLHASGSRIEGASAYDTKQGFVQFTIEKAMVSLSAGPGLVWSYLGAATLLLVLVLLVQRSWLKGLAIFALVIAIPIVVGFTFGEDRTRDITLVCAPVILALVMTGSGWLSDLVHRLPGDPRVWLNWLAILVTIIPATYFYLDAEEPWRWTKELLVSLNNGVPLLNDGSAR